jgi:hypothetical protein
MAIQDKKDEIKSPEKVSAQQEQAVHFDREHEKILERKENPDDEIVSRELRREIEMMELDPANAKAAEIEKEKIEYLGEKEKIEHLLNVARERDLVYAVQVAKKMGDPYILDLLHDTLAKEGFYKDFIKNRK